MAVIEYDEYKQKLLALEPTLGELEKALGIPKAREELAQLQKETEQEGFWNDLERSQQVSRQVKRLENKIKKHDKLVSEWEDTLTLCEMAQEEDDPSQLDDVVEGYNTLEKEISERRLAALLTARCKKMWLAPLPPVLANTVLIGLVLAYEQAGTSAAFWPTYGFNALTVGLGEVVACYGLGMLLLWRLSKSTALQNYLKNR